MNGYRITSRGIDYKMPRQLIEHSTLINVVHRICLCLAFKYSPIAMSRLSLNTSHLWMNLTSFCRLLWTLFLREFFAKAYLMSLTIAFNETMFYLHWVVSKVSLCLVFHLRHFLRWTGVSQKELRLNFNTFMMVLQLLSLSWEDHRKHSVPSASIQVKWLTITSKRQLVIS